MNRRRTLLPIPVLLLCMATAALGLPPVPTIADELVPEPVLVLPAVLDPLHWGTARCSDGTPFGFMLELSPTGSREWVLYLEGGGFCEDNAVMCEDRYPRWTTTPGDEALEYYALVRTRALFSPDDDWNPTFHDANKAYAFYCSNDVWSGDTVERRPTSADPAGWYFSGRANVKAMVEALQAYYGLDDAHAATEVLFAGISAGGEGVQAAAAIVYRLLPRVTRKGHLRVVNDAGSVFLFDDPDHRFASTDLTFKQVMVDAYDFWGSTLNPYCERAQVMMGKRRGECSDEVVVYPFIVRPRPYGLGLPLFVQHSSIDGYQLREHQLEEPEDVELFRANTLLRFGEVQWTWLWSGGAFAYHTTLWRDDRWDMGPEGQTLREVLGRFWEDQPPEVVIYGNP